MTTHPSDSHEDAKRLDALPPVPQFEVDRFRNKVDTTGTKWHLVDPAHRITINWDLVAEGEIKVALQLWICRCIRRHSPMEVQNQFKECKKAIALDLPRPSTLDAMDLEWWRKLRSALEAGGVDRRYLMHRPRQWFGWLADQGWVDEDTAFEIETWRIPGNAKGEAVSSMDKDSGPLDDVQFSVLWQAAIRPQPLTLGQAATLLCLDLGSNPKSLVLLEERDIRAHVDPKTGRRRFLLAVPRMKKRTKDRHTKLRHISPETGTLLEALVALNQNQWGGPDPKRPIICRQKPRSDEVVPGMRRFRLHHTTSEFRQLVSGYGKAQGLRAPGGGDTTFRITPRRLRYTFATRLAIEGASAVLIAELLDHTDLQHVRVYVDAGGRLVNVLTTALGPRLESTVGRFMGKMVDRPEDAVPNDPLAHVPAKVSGGMIGHIGTCGCGSACRFAPPFGCYQCAHFQPWSNADHEGLLSNLQRYRDAARMGDGTGVVTSAFDQVIEAVEGVIALKHQRRQTNAT